MDLGPLNLAVVVPGAVAVIVAGQSNAVGHGILLPEDLEPEPGVYVVKQNGRVYPGADPLHLGGGVGFGRTLARELILGGYPQVWLITAGVGNTSAPAWARGLLTASYHVPSEAQLYAAAGSWLTIDCQLQVQLLRRAAPDIKVVAIAWHQGESGCASLAATNVRVADLTQIRDRMKQDNPGAVWVGGELARSTACPYRAQTNQATEQVADGYVTSEGLTTNPGDLVHFDRASQHELGSRYGRKILELLG